MRGEKDLKEHDAVTTEIAVESEQKRKKVCKKDNIAIEREQKKEKGRKWRKRKIPE